MKPGDRLSPELDAAGRGLLLSRPLPLQPDSVPPAGLQPLHIESDRDGLLYVPQGYSPERPAPLVLSLHGAGGDAHGGMAPFLSLADEAGMILLSPDSRSSTWDVIR
jgi:dipeptidyl aminopeptidase/acylaminoacyl peptidase